MGDGEWVRVGEFNWGGGASWAANRLIRRGIPAKLMKSGVFGDPNSYVWVPHDRASEAKAILATDEGPEDELTKEALRYPPPDDA